MEYKKQKSSLPSYYEFPRLIKIINDDPEKTVVEFNQHDFAEGDWITADYRYGNAYIVDNINDNIVNMHLAPYHLYDEQWLQVGLTYYLISTNAGEFDEQ